MNEYLLERPDYDDYEAEQERLRRMRKRLAHEFDIADGKAVFDTGEGDKNEFVYH